MVSLLRQNHDESLFWAYELACSGWSSELMRFFEKIYYFFYYTQTPTFEDRLCKFVKEIDTNVDANMENTYKTIAQLVKLFVKLPFNLDVYLLCCWCNVFDEIDEGEDEKTVSMTLLAQRIFQKHTGLKDAHVYVHIAHALESYQKQKQDQIKAKRIYLTRLSSETWLPFTNPNIQTGALVLHQTQILKPIVYFETTEMNPSDWLYHAYFSPIWKQRIDSHHGIILAEKKQVSFSDDEDAENFYDKYGYEFDEKSKTIQQRFIPISLDKDKDKYILLTSLLSSLDKHITQSVVSLEQEELSEMKILSPQPYDNIL